MINCLSQEEKNSILFSILSQIQSKEDLDELKRDLNKWNITRQICGDINKEESNKEEQEHDDSWCNADCEKAEGCIECNPMAFCSAETFAKWQDDCVSRMNPITNE